MFRILLNPISRKWASWFAWPFLNSNFRENFNEFFSRMSLYLTDDALELDLEVKDSFWFIRINRKFYKNRRKERNRTTLNRLVLMVSYQSFYEMICSTNRCCKKSIVSCAMWQEIPSSWKQMSTDIVQFWWEEDLSCSRNEFREVCKRFHNKFLDSYNDSAILFLSSALFLKAETIMCHSCQITEL